VETIELGGAGVAYLRKSEEPKLPADEVR